MDFPFAGVALQHVFLVTADSEEIRSDRLLEDLNRLKVENEQLMKLMLLTEAAMKATYTCLVDTKKK